MDDNKNWNDAFKVIVRDKFLIQEGRGISHLRNTVCHMSDISDEEVNRIRQVMRESPFGRVTLLWKIAIGIVCVVMIGAFYFFTSRNFAHRFL